MKHLITILSLLLCLNARATNYYISTAGNNSNNGTSTGTPWQTLAKLSSVTLQAGDVIYLRRGDTFFGPLPVSRGDISFTAYGTGAEPIITGLTSLTSWTNLGGNIWETSVNSGSSLNMVTVNGVVTAMGRYPNYNPSDGGYLYVDASTFNRGSGICGGGVKSCGTITDAALSGGGVNWTGAEAVQRAVEWVLDRTIVTSHSAGNSTFSFNNFTDEAEPEHNEGYFFQNHVATLDAQNEWFYNPSTFTLRMYSTVNPSTLNVKAATLERLAEWYYHDNISFSYIHFIGADEYAIRSQGGSTDLIYSSSVTNCTVEQVGVYGIRADGWVNSSVSANYVHDINSIGIEVSNSGMMTVNYNTVKRIGLLPGMALSGNQQHDGIRWEDAKEGVSTFNYNRVDSVGYCGIYYHGSGTIVRYNYVTNFNMTVSDGGGIYTNGDSIPTIDTRYVEYNIILYGIGNSHGTTHLGTPGGSIGVYCDDFSRNVTIRYNTIGYCTRNGILLHQSQNIIVTDNTLFRNEIGILFVQDDFGIVMPTRNITFKRNVIMGEANKWLIENGSYTNDFHLQFASADSNYFSRPPSTKPDFITTNYGPPTVYGEYTLAEWRAAFPAYEVHSTFTTPPPADSIFFQSNWTGSPVTVSLPGLYKSLSGTTYTTGTAQVPAYGSLFLYRTGNLVSNLSPVANAGANVSITQPTSATSLSGSTSTDPDGTVVSYNWSTISGPGAITFSAPNSASTNVSGLVVGVHLIKLTITDNGGATASDTVQVTVVNANPIANAGPDQTVLGTTANHVGSGTDNGGSIAGYGWIQVNGPSTATFSSTTIASPVVSNLVPGTYVFRVTVTDNNGGTATDDVTIIVRRAPVVSVGNDKMVILPVNYTSLSAIATDADGTVVSYSWAQLAGPNTATFSSTTTANPNLTGLIQGMYYFRLTVTDNHGYTSNDDITVTVNPANNTPPTVNAGSDVTITLPRNAVTFSGTASDADGPINLAWSKQSGPDYTINNAASGNATVTLSAPGTYVFRLTATDNDGATTHDELTITVLPDPLAAGTTLKVQGNIKFDNVQP